MIDFHKKYTNSGVVSLVPSFGSSTMPGIWGDISAAGGCDNSSDSVGMKVGCHRDHVEVIRSFLSFWFAFCRVLGAGIPVQVTHIFKNK